MTEATAIATTDDESPRAILVRRAQHGDHAAFDELVRTDLARHLRFALSLVDNEADARDVVQDTCLKAWRELPRLRDPGRFDSWFNQILVNTARSQLRTRRRTRVREISSDTVGQEGHRDGLGRPSVAPSSDAHDGSEADVIRRAFDRLSPDKRTLLVLHHVDGRTVTDIAAVLRIPEGTVKWRLHSARRALEQALEVEGR